jgi:hypothetical protein
MANGLLNNPDIFNVLTDLEMTAYIENYYLEIDASSDPFGLNTLIDGQRAYYLKFQVIKFLS